MGKLRPSVEFRPNDYLGTQILQAAYRPELVDFLRTLKPWAWWDKDEKHWILTDQAAEQAAEWCRNHGYSVTPMTPWGISGDALDERLFPYQVHDVCCALDLGYRFLAYEMSGGKTPTSIAALRAAGIRRALIVCPASIREVWLQQLEKWWPDHPPTTIMYSGKDPVPDGDGFVVTSYELLPRFVSVNGKHVSAPSDRWEALIADESHYIKNSRSQRSVIMQELSEANPRALRLALTGTPIANSPQDLYAQLNWLTPKRWGSFWQFAYRYCLVEDNGFGKIVHGSKNPEELKVAFLDVGSRITYDDFKQHMPKVRPPQSFRVNCIMDGLLDIAQGTDRKLLVFTYLRADAQRLARDLANQLPKREVFWVTGDLPPRERFDILEQARAADSAILVATMDSVGTGIDLSAFPTAIFAGLSYKLTTVLQAIGRVVRLTQKEPVQLYFVVARGTDEELKAMALEEKLSTNTEVVAGGNAEERLGELIGVPTVSDEDFLTQVREETLETFGGDDEYL